MRQISEGDLNFLELTAKYTPSDLAKPENASKIIGLLAEANAATTYQETIEHLEEEVERLEDEVIDLRQTLDDQENQITELQDRVAELEGEAEALREEIDVLG